MLDASIKNLLIDFGGVLIDLNRRRCLEHFRQLGMPDVEGLLNDYRQEGFFQLHEKGLISDNDFRGRIRQAASRPLTDEAIDEAWNSFLDGIPAYKLDFLLELRKRYNVCLLSNTNAIHWGRLFRPHLPFLSNEDGQARRGNLPSRAGRHPLDTGRNPVHRRCRSQLPRCAVAWHPHLYPTGP